MQYVRLLRHLRIEEAVNVYALLLLIDKARGSFLKQLHCLGPVIRSKRDSDAGSDERRLAIEEKRPVDHVDDLPGERRTLS